MKARFTHDCTNPGCCTLVGITSLHDVYLSRSGTLIMRFGDDGPDYLSAPLVLARLAANHSSTYWDAVRLVDEFNQVKTT